MPRPRKPCQRCGGEKEPGYGKVYCPTCRPIALAESHARELEGVKRWHRAHPNRPQKQYSKPTKPCRGCGGPKGPGVKGRTFCPACVAAGVPAQRRREREVRAAERRHAQRQPCVACGGTKAQGAKKYCDACLAAGIVVRAARERSKLYNREHRAERRDRDNASARRKLHENPEMREANKLRARAWAKANPERIAENRRRSVYRYRTRKLDAFVEEVESLVVLEMDDGVCGICGSDVDPFNFHVDHIIPLALGGLHTYQNTQPAHPNCNRAKGGRMS